MRGHSAVRLDIHDELPDMHDEKEAARAGAWSRDDRGGTSEGGPA
ncbi:hypothetical protein FHR32_006757 [Streptosporangium album]|uniref:Uncharacterized protein n=1 Tax=Streptosporangium album TaxID=47479 RepID=A0A7W7S3N7_9ACTN|nr:hypothetical protein [Streptosporangium album]MBB4942371.1 hypothetical protein [Streptosporangium album]